MERKFLGGAPLPLKGWGWGNGDGVVHFAIPNKTSLVKDMELEHFRISFNFTYETGTFSHMKYLNHT